MTDFAKEARDLTAWAGDLELLQRKTIAALERARVAGRAEAAEIARGWAHDSETWEWAQKRGGEDLIQVSAQHGVAIGIADAILSASTTPLEGK